MSTEPACPECQDTGWYDGDTPCPLDCPAAQRLRADAEPDGPAPELAQPDPSQPLPAAPIYVISKGRAQYSHTHRMLNRYGVPHLVVVEPQEEDLYRQHNPGIQLEVLPFSNLGLGSIPARNHVWDHAVEAGADHHWILDDNICAYRQRFPGDHIRYQVSPAAAFHGVETFCARYENIGLAGCEYHMFSPPGAHKTPVSLNRRVFSNLYIDHRLPYRWRGRYNEDTDLTLQVLSSGYWCTLLFNHWLAHKLPTLMVKGGNTDQLYAPGTKGQDDGRVKMARSLERQWPRLVTTHRIWDRAQHYVRSWNFPQTPIPAGTGSTPPEAPRG